MESTCDDIRLTTLLGATVTGGSTVLQQSSAVVIGMVVTHLIHQLIRHLNPFPGSSVSTIDYLSVSIEQMIERLERAVRLARNGRT